MAGLAPALLSAETLAEIAFDVVASEVWVPHARIDEVCRHHVRLLTSETYEAWLLGWAPGQHVGLHDHGDAAGAFLVVDGDLVEVLPRVRRSTRRLSPGTASVMPPGHLHDVGIRSTAPALSVHVYSPPLSTMTYYDEAGLVPLRTESLTPVRGG